jgi:cell division protein FtsN
MVTTFPASDTESAGKSSRTAVAVGVSVVAIIALLIVAVITAYLIIWRVKGHAKPSTLPTVHYQPHADINMGQGIRNAIYSSGTST